MDIFADEHMVEMNRKSRVDGGRKRVRLRSPSPYPGKPLLNASPTPNHPPGSGDTHVEKSSDVSAQKERSNSMIKELQNSSSKEDGLMVKQQSSEDGILKDLNAVVLFNSHAEPFKSSALPEEKSNCLPTKTSLDKINQPRKRDRTPSPTFLPNSKRSSISGDLKRTSAVQILRSVSGVNHLKSPSPIPGNGSGRLGKVEISSASRVLTEEIQKQQGQVNAKLKLLIVKEVRKQGKSECISLSFTVLVFSI